MHLAVAAAVATATAVLTGALIVGDSVRGSLRDLTFQRLGRIDRALTAPRLFRQELATEIASEPGFEEHFREALPALVLQGSATARVEDATRRASNLSLYGVSQQFWNIGRVDPRSDPSGQGVWLTQQIADDLRATAGDEVVIHLPLKSEVPADSPLGEKVDTLASRRVQVAGVLPDRGLARFGLQPSQRPPRAIFAPLDVLAEAIEQPGRANSLLITSDSVTSATGESANEWLAANFHPKLADYGLAVEMVDPVAGSELGAVQISADGLVLPPQVIAAAEQAFGDSRLQPINTYLANTIAIGDRSIAYSTVSGVDSTEALGPLLDAEGKAIPIAPTQVVLNSWAARQLQAKLGDTVTLRFYEPESTHGALREREPPLELTLIAIAELADASGGATRAADPSLTPQLEGVTDQQSISDWDLPFELTEPITQADEDYWDEYRTTPKAFVSFQIARDTWRTRWGAVSLLRLPATNEMTASSVAAQLRKAIDPADLGFAIQPVKAQGLAAASGTTPFGGLFLGFSMFLIASAIMLLFLLFRLGVEGRAQEIGLLTAIGYSHQRTRRLLAIEAMCVAVVGAVAGALLGVFYAWAMVAALKTLWVAAIAAPFLDVHIGPWSLPVGFLLGLAAAGAATMWTLRSVLTQSPRALLAGAVEEAVQESNPLARKSRSRRWPVSEVLLGAAVLAGALGSTQSGQAQAGAFFAVGALVLAGLLGLVHRRWRSMAASRSQAASPSLARMAMANLSRQPGRSTLTMGLVASATFLLLAIGAFRLTPTDQGTGGYEWYAESAVPIHYDLGSEGGQLELGFRDDEMDQLAGYEVESLRVHGGEDASCLNLYHTMQPRVVGIRNPERVLADFGWAAKAETESGAPNLDALAEGAPLGNDENGRAITPVVLDLATAMYSLHLSGSVGDQLVIRDSDDQSVTLEVVGLLQNSILQGDLLIGDANFRKLFPAESGSRLFLIRDKAEQTLETDESLEAMLENRLSDFGFSVTSADQRLSSFLAVQNTYLSTFQSLGGLGLLLGTIGLAVVQLRNVLERRGELALMQAIGFRRHRLVLLVLLENAALLAGGLLMGSVAAALALLPQLATFQTSLPWQTMLALVIVVIVVGLVATWLATRQTLRQPILPALRGD